MAQADEHHPDKDGPQWLTTRRKFLLAGALAGAGSMSVADALDDDGAIGNLWAGIAALNQAYNVAGNLYVGPDSAKSSIDAKSGRMYMATDIQVDYYGDGGSWVEMGVGSSSNPVPSVYADAVTTEQLDNVRYASAFNGADGGTQIQNAVDDLPSQGGVVIVGPEGPDDVSGSSGSVSDGREKNAWELTSEISLSDNQTLYFINSYVFLADSTFTGSTTGYLVKVGGSTNVTVAGTGTLDGNKSNNDGKVQGVQSQNGSDDLTVKEITITDCNDQAGNIGSSSGDNTNRVTWKDTTIKDCVEGVIFSGCQDSDFKDNDLQNITTEDGFETTSGCENIDVVDNDFDTIGGQAIDIFSASRYISVRDNTIENTATSRSRPAIEVETNGTENKHVQVVGNTIETANGQPAIGVGLTFTGGTNSDILIADNLIDVATAVKVGKASDVEVRNNKHGPTVTDPLAVTADASAPITYEGPDDETVVSEESVVQIKGRQPLHPWGIDFVDTHVENSSPMFVAAPSFDDADVTGPSVTVGTGSLEWVTVADNLDKLNIRFRWFRIQHSESADKNPNLENIRITHRDGTTTTTAVATASGGSTTDSDNLIESDSGTKEWDFKDCQQEFTDVVKIELQYENTSGVSATTVTVHRFHPMSRL